MESPPLRGLLVLVLEELGGQGAVAVEEHAKHRDLGRHGARRAVAAGAALMSLGMLGYGTAPAVLALVPLSVLGGVGNGMVNVCVATLVTTRTEERMRGRVAAAMGAVLNTASVGSLAAGGALAAVLAPRQVYLLAGALGCAVTVVLAARLRPAGSAARYFVRC